jgi:SNF2 family DNA or RNA helicase
MEGALLMAATLKIEHRDDEDVLKLSLSGLGGGEFQDALQKAKSIQGRRWNPDEKVWEYRADVQTAQKLVNMIRPAPDAEILGWLRDAAARIADEITTWLPEDAELRIENADQLYAFQRAAVEFIVRHPRTILADDMGLGKTVEALSGVIEHAIQHEDDYAARPKLVVSPAGLAGSWKQEIQTWTGEEAVIVKGRWGAGRRATVLKQAIRENRWVIVNTEQVRAHLVEQPDGRKLWELRQPILTEADWYAIIADEAHRFKGYKSQQSIGLRRLHAPVQLALTGSPILNRPGELWPLLAWLRPEQYGENHRDKIGYWRFVADYEESYEVTFRSKSKGNRRVRIVTGVRNADQLRFELKDKLVRRTKRLLRELGILPEKLPVKHVPVELNPGQRRLYDEALKALVLDVEAAYHGEEAESILHDLLSGDAEAFARAKFLIPNGASRVMRLRQIASSPALLGGEDDSAKLDTAVEIIGDAQEKPLVVFTWFKGTTKLLQERLARQHIEARTFTGDTPEEARTELTEAFQRGEFQVMIATIAAGGVGQTWTAADTAIFIERDWTPEINRQAEDRLHRIGQSNDVTIVVIEAVDTVDTGEVAMANQLKSLLTGQVFGADEIREENLT